MKKIGSLFAILGLAAGFAFASPAMALDFSLDGNFRGACSTASASGNGTAATATLANKCGVITTEALTAPTNSEYTLTLTDTVVAAGDIPLVTVGNGSNTTGLAVLARATVSANTLVIVVRQANTTNFNGTLSIRYLVIKP